MERKAHMDERDSLWTFIIREVLYFNQVRDDSVLFYSFLQSLLLDLGI